MSQHNRATSAGEADLQMHAAQGKDLSAQLDRYNQQQNQQNNARLQQTRQSAAAGLQEQAEEQRQYNLKLGMQEGGSRGSSQPHNLNLAQIDYSSPPYNYAGQGHGPNTTKNQSLQNQGGIEFAAGASQAA